jgi:hypothetical protein
MPVLGVELAPVFEYNCADDVVEGGSMGAFGFY